MTKPRMRKRASARVAAAAACCLALNVHCSAERADPPLDAGEGGTTSEGGSAASSGVAGTSPAGAAGASDASTLDQGADAPVVAEDTSDSSQNCEWKHPSGGDPETYPLDCANPAWQIGTPTISEEGDLLRVGIGWCGLCGNYLCSSAGNIDGLSATASGDWATVVSAVMVCPYLVTLQPAPGVTEGTMTLHGSIHGLDQCHSPLTCPIELVYHIWKQADAGTWVIAL